MARPIGLLGGIAFVWGFGGVCALILNAVVRLTPMALGIVGDATMSWWHWALFVGWVGFMVYSEGYRGFHKRFSPMVVARSLHLAHHPRLLHVVLAPAFCMGLFHATRRRLVLSWGLLVGVTVLVVLVRMLSQPWRGIIDAGVVIGLVVGLASMVAFALAALFGKTPSVSAELPGPAVG